MTKAFENYLSQKNQPTPQTEQADPSQVQNNAGGFSFVVSDKNRLERFLILGTDGGTYYVSEQDLTTQNVDWLIDLIQTNAPLVLNTVADISRAGRAYRNSNAIFTLALVFKYGDEESKSVAKVVFNDVVRTSTHLFEFANYVELLGINAHNKALANESYRSGMASVAKRIETTVREATGRSKKIDVRDRFSGSHTGGWGRAKRSVVANWYQAKTPESLAYQAVKYRQRNGWTHQDLFRLAHPKGINEDVAAFILGKTERVDGETVPQVIFGYQWAQQAVDKSDLLAVLAENPNLPWEALPTKFLKEPEVWKTLFYNGQLNGQALLRNITRLARISAFDDMVFTRDYAARLGDEDMIQKTRLHPIQYLLALTTHQEGQLRRGSYSALTWFHSGQRAKDWITNPMISAALNDGFYKAFKYVAPAGKRTMLGLDVSGSMSSLAMGLDLSCAQIGAAMAMTIARTEPYYQIMGFADKFRDLGIDPSMNLSEVLRRTKEANFGRTDCALPMYHALTNKIEVDTFVVITDNETWAGRHGHPHQVLNQYRQKMGIDARLVVMGLTATGFSIADPKDAGMLDICGADTNIPRVVADFSACRI